jgi:RNA polymerase-binding transcription factor DksA
MMIDDFVYNNEEESELGQLHAIHIHLNAIADVQRQLAAQAQQPSSTYCQECGDDIPLARQRLIPGVTLCVHCKQRGEVNFARF